MKVGVKVKNSPVTLSAKVTSRAGGMNEVLHDETLIGNGNNEPLGVNPDIIPDVNELNTQIQNLHDMTASIQDVIPPTANYENQLADQGFVNSSIQTSTAHFRGNWDTWADVPSAPELYPADAYGNHAPTPNDYLVVVDDEQGGTWRYKYTGDWSEQGKDGWRAEYQINETPLTAAQLAALNSNVTAQAVADIATNKSNITALQNGKQDKLVAGDGITIDGNTISASGGGGGVSGDYLPLTGGTLTGKLVVPENKGLQIGTRTIFDQNGMVLYIYPSGSTSSGGLKFTNNEIYSTYLSKYTKLGISGSPWGTAYVMKLNNGADLAVPTTGGTIARIEDIDAAVGDISTALTAILGE